MDKKLTVNLSPRLSDVVKFQPKAETLRPLSELLKESVIKPTDPGDANEAWKSHCPDDEFINLLESQ